MPRQQVYGKRSRAIYDPVAIFASPQHVTTKPNADLRLDDIDEELSRLAIEESEKSSCKTSVRRALGQRDANSVVIPILPVAEKPKRRPRARRVISDESGQQTGLEQCATTKSQSPKSRPRTPLKSPRISAPIHISLGHDGAISDTEQPSQDDLCTVAEPEELDEDLPLQHVPVSSLLSARPSISLTPPTPPMLDVYETHCLDLLSLSSHSITPFAEWSSQLTNHFNITKIAEASFGEVYRLSLLQELPGLASRDESVFKIIALKPPTETLPTQKRQREATLKKAVAMSAPADVASEVKLLQRMSSIPGFTNFRDVRIVQGRPPPTFIQAFKAFNAIQKAKQKDLSTFPDPARKTSYADDQLWAVIEMQDAGTDLERCVENGSCSTIWTVWDVFWQVVLSLAKGEEGAEFEHRDLHLGNICVRSSTEFDHADVATAVEAKRKLGFTSVETTLIDYTISRASMLSDWTSAEDGADQEVAHIDLSKDSALFEGDSTDEYQYEIYRYMRSALFLDDALAVFEERRQEAMESGRTWQGFHPQTNLVWLHFVLYKLLEQVEWPSATKAPAKKAKREHAVWKRANDLEHVLLRLQELLDPSVICKNDVASSRGLIGLALNEGWLDVEDVVGAGGETSELATTLEELKLESEQAATIQRTDHEAIETPTAVEAVGRSTRRRK